MDESWTRQVLQLFGLAKAKKAASDLPPRPKGNEASLVKLQPQDFYQFSTAAGMGPETFSSALQEANQGRLRSLAEILEDILERWPHLAGVMGTRVNQVASAPWKLEAEDPTDPEAVDIAKRMTVLVKRIPRLRRAMTHLGYGTYYSLAAQQIRWGYDAAKGENFCSGLDFVPSKRFLYNTQNTDLGELNELRLSQGSGDITGISLPPAKFLVHRPTIRSGFPTRLGLGRLLGWFYIFSIYGLKDWGIFAEKFGMPLILARTDEQPGSPGRMALEEALASMGTDAVAVLSTMANIEFRDRGGSTGADVYGAWLGFLDAACSKAVVGHSGGADSTPGRLGAEDVAVDVRQLIRDLDASELGETMKEDLLTPLATWNYGSGAPVPLFVPQVKKPTDKRELAERIGLLRGAKVPIPLSWVYQQQDIPAPQPGEATLPTDDQQGSPPAYKAGAA